MPEQRKHKRFAVDIFGINDKTVFANEVEIHDISVGGISVKVDRRLNMGSEYTMKITNSMDESISLRGSVVWSKLTGTKKGEKDEAIPLYVAGMKFIRISDDKIINLTTFMQGQEGFSPEKVHKAGAPGELRCSMRFLVKTPLSKAVLKISENYNVKKISLGGMLIESDNPLSVEERLPMEILLPDAQIKLSGRIAFCSESPAIFGEEPVSSHSWTGYERLR